MPLFTFDFTIIWHMSSLNAISIFQALSPVAGFLLLDLYTINIKTLLPWRLEYEIQYLPQYFIAILAQKYSILSQYYSPKYSIYWIVHRNIAVRNTVFYRNTTARNTVFIAVFHRNITVRNTVFIAILKYEMQYFIAILQYGIQYFIAILQYEMQYFWQYFIAILQYEILYFIAILQYFQNF